MSDKQMSDKQRAFKRYKAATARHGKPFFPYGTYHDVIAGTVAVAIVVLLSVVWFAQANCDSWFDTTCPKAASPTAQEQYTPGHVGMATFTYKHKVDPDDPADHGTKETWIFVQRTSDLPNNVAEVDAKSDKRFDGVKVSGGLWQGEENEYFTTSYQNIPDEAEALEGEAHPKLGPLYEEIADPGTTEYDPKPEWYFFFLFQLLRIFSKPGLVLLGTIGIPTVALVVLMAWPFIDRKRERRPSRRPVAMVGMASTAVVLLALTWAGAHAGSAGGSYGTAEQQEMAGYALVFDDDRTSCKNCHTLGEVWSGTAPGAPNLSEEASKNRGIEWQFDHLKDPKSKVPNSGMIAQSPLYTDEELMQIAGFLETLGKPERAGDEKYTDAKADTE